MKLDGWIELVNETFDKNDKDTMKIIAQHCWNSERAKNMLRRKGYGWTGLDIVETARLVDKNT